MKLAALILGIVGGVFGLMGSCTALTVGAIGSSVGTEGANTVVGLGWAALALSVVGIVGGAIAMAKTKAAGWMMLIAGIGGLISISAAYILAAPLLVVGGLIALFAKSTVPGTPAAKFAQPSSPVRSATAPGEEPQQFCSHCGAQNPKIAKFCASCGKEMILPSLGPAN